ncbi:arsenosugar biosynthesis radical SAM (seleno)protein ArsS [Thiohalomonas denitrificans]|uniref:Radical SAM/Cys-rich domain-containing protein n=1 Tax=Thiohalomonas denitrificans TaxID=415747 RepID=A0A1G5Q959_9GAMM|nr:arsenosugar biosynthesis radical SAM (seleno)protein ArsS [Thiohalomonas denitrificans]SCZ58383.1 radical SAM/Cys-rich domain-containing protein [Thiohalomonas denitrificans]
MLATLPLLQNGAFPVLQRDQPDTLQVNLGYRCNQSCLHCHVGAGPKRKEQMSAEIVTQVITCLESGRFIMLDLTGGAPELNPHFRQLVTAARHLGLRVIDRCNLTVLEEPGQETLAGFLAEQRVEVIASLPCYLEENVDGQRGRGVFEASLRGLRRLNALGYGQPDSGRVLNLVYNPTGPFLPPPQGPLEGKYREQLREQYGVVFNQLFTLTNLPIQRFGSRLISEGGFETYMQLLQEAFETRNLEQVMCRTLVSVDWQGWLYDCDFNQMLHLPLRAAGRERTHVSELAKLDLAGNPITVADHCFGCTAGQGSSCGGALS